VKNIFLIKYKLRELQEKISKLGTNDEMIIEANELAEFLVEITKDTYNKTAETYAGVRTYDISETDLRAWERLRWYISEKINVDYSKVKFLDVGTGSGRDIKYASGLGFNIIGVDNSDTFIEILKRLEEENRIPKGSFRKADMRELPFEDSTFDVVRQQAALVHLPIIEKGYMADKAIEESYRVLKENGLLYIFVKKGEGIQYIDTNEGMGGRIFQFYDEYTIKNLVERNGFKTLEIRNEKDSRNCEIILLIAQK